MSDRWNQEDFVRELRRAIEQAGNFYNDPQGVFIPGVPTSVSVSLDNTPSSRRSIYGDYSRESLISEGGQSSNGAGNHIQLNIIDLYRDLSPKFGEGDPIGVGGFSWAYKHKFHGQDVVVKDLNMAFQSGSDVSVYKEIFINCLHDHPNIMKFYGASVKPGQRAIVVEYVEYDLRTFIHDPRKDNHVRVETILKITRGVASALHHLHSKNIAHRDLHPQNIRISQDGFVKVGDVGLSKLLEHSLSYNSQRDGIWCYLAPEVFEGRIHRKSDIYSLAVIIAEMWWRQKPWAGLTESQIKENVGEGRRPFSQISADTPMPGVLSQIVEGCWKQHYKLCYSAEDVVRICDEELELLQAQLNQGVRN